MKLVKNPVSTLDLDEFRGNLMHVVLSMPETFVMPASVTCTFYESENSTRSLSLQPDVEVLGKQIHIKSETMLLPSRYFHVIRFDNQAKFAGNGSVSHRTNSSPEKADVSLTVTIEDNVPVHVQVINSILDASGELEAPNYLNLYELFKQI